MKYHPAVPVEQAQIMLRLSLEGINTHTHTRAHVHRAAHARSQACTWRAYDESKQSKHIVWPGPAKVRIAVPIYIQEQSSKLRPGVFFSPLERRRRRSRKKGEKQITPAGAARHETFQLKCNFHPPAIVGG